MDIYDLLQKIRQPGARLGIGIWLLPRHLLGQEEILALRLDMQAIDARQFFLQSLPQGARFSGLTRQNGHFKLVEMVRQLTERDFKRSCLLVHTLDLLLLGMEVDERKRFWLTVLEGIPYPNTKLVLTIPEGANELLPLEIKHHYAMYIAEGGIK